MSIEEVAFEMEEQKVTRKRGQPAKSMTKVKAKAKAKSAKAKAKARLAKAKAKALAKGAAAMGQDNGEPNEFQIMVAPKPKAAALGGFRKRVLNGLGSKHIDDAIQEQRIKKQRVLDISTDIEAEKAAYQAEIAKNHAEFQCARAQVADAMAKEIEAALAFKAARVEKEDCGNKVKEARNKLALAQKKYAMVEVLAMNQKKMKEFEEAKRSATETANAAKRSLQEQRLKEKKALEETKRVIAEQKAKFKEQQALAFKRISLTPTDADTVPATLPVGLDLE